MFHANRTKHYLQASMFTYISCSLILSTRFGVLAQLVSEFNILRKAPKFTRLVVSRNILGVVLIDHPRPQLSKVYQYPMIM